MVQRINMLKAMLRNSKKNSKYGDITFLNPLKVVFAVLNCKIEYKSYTKKQQPYDDAL